MFRRSNAASNGNSNASKGLRFDPDSLMQAAQARITDVELQRSAGEPPWDGVLS